MGPNQLRFLKEHDLGGPFMDKDINFLFEIVDNGKGIHYKFHDHKLQKRFAKFVEAARKFVVEVAVKRSL